MPTQSLGRAVPEPRQEEDDEPETGPDLGRFAAQAAAASSIGGAPEAPPSPADVGAGAETGERARAEYDYEAQEDNEVSFAEGEILTDIQKVDPDWWVVTNSKGQQGLVPANYLQIIEGDDHIPASTQPAVNQTPAAPVPTHAPAASSSQGKTAKALYDYEAGEDNEISFPEDAIITNIVSSFRTGPRAIANFDRNFPTMTGGRVNTRAKLGCSPQPTSSFKVRHELAPAVSLSPWYRANHIHLAILNSNSQIGVIFSC